MEKTNPTDKKSLHNKYMREYMKEYLKTNENYKKRKREYNKTREKCEICNSEYTRNNKGVHYRSLRHRMAENIIKNLQMKKVLDEIKIDMIEI